MKRFKQTRLCVELLEDRTTPSYGFGYALGLGSAGIDMGIGVAADAAGNVTVAGSYGAPASGAIDLDPGPGSYVLPSADGNDAFAAQYDGLGNLRWGLYFTSAGSNGAGDVAVDGSGNIFVAGNFEGTLDIGAPGTTPVTLTAASGREGFLAKIDPSGNVLWARTLGEAGANRVAADLATDAAGNVFATGLLYGTQALQQTFIARYAGSNGATDWSAVIQDGTGITYPSGLTYAGGRGIAVDASGNVCVTGSYVGTIDFNPDPTQTHWLTNTGTTQTIVNIDADAFLLKLNSAGSYAWSGSLGGRYHDSGDGVSLDGAGNVYVNGGYVADTQNDFDPGAGTLQLAGSGYFVVKLDSNQNATWGRGGVGGSPSGGAMKVDAAGNVYTTGGFSGTLDADPGPGTFNLTSAGSNDVLVSKLDSAGNFVWAASMGGPGSDMSRAIALDGQGNLYTTGSFQQTSDFDPSAGVYNLSSTLDANSNATSDVFVSKLVPAAETLPALRISDVAVSEGNSGTVSAVFTVSLSATSDQTVTVSYSSADGTASAGSDYQAASGTLTFTLGETSKTITVLVNGDRISEPNETFSVNLSQATNASISDGLGVGTILDDEPRISINDVTKAEGKKGQTTLFTFTVTLSAAYDQAVTMSFRTVDGTATTSDGDYVAKTGTLTFAPGETKKTITIEVKGDSKKEANETFYLDLFGLSSNSLFTKNCGIGTILNDD